MNLYIKINENKKAILLSVIILFIAMVGYGKGAFAFDGDDPLSGTERNLIMTLGASGTGRKFIYLIEGIVAIATYIKTKNIMMFSGVLAIAIFLNILFKVAGLSQ